MAAYKPGERKHNFSAKFFQRLLPLKQLHTCVHNLNMCHPHLYAGTTEEFEFEDDALIDDEFPGLDPVGKSIVQVFNRLQLKIEQNIEYIQREPLC